MTTVLLSAGNATRLGPAAPGGCKALVEVGGRTMLDWWWEVGDDDDLLVVVRSEHVELCPALEGVRYAVCDEGGGPARALAHVLPLLNEGPITVAYADTWLPGLPRGEEWCGVAAARGGRRWDVVEDGLLAYRDVDLGEVALVAVGAYRFGARWRLELALDHELRLAPPDAEVGLADVVNDLGLPLVPVQGWRDVGDRDALAAWSPA